MLKTHEVTIRLYIILEASRCILGLEGVNIKLTGSGEVHNSLGSLKLPRRLDCLPVLEQTRFRKLGYREIASYYVLCYKHGERVRLVTAEPEYG